MKKTLLFSALLFAATTLFAATKVETFVPEDGANTNTYVTTVTSKKCDQATWTFFSGGILKNLGNMGSDNFAAVIRSRKKGETVLPYMYSDTITGGIDSLWFTWNSNGNETPFGNWDIKIYINDNLVGNITEKAGNKIASAPFNTFKVGNLNVEGNFVIKFVNDSRLDTTANALRFVFDDLSWTTFGAAEKETPTFAFAEKSVIKMTDAIPFTNALINTSDATPVFVSSNPDVATVTQTGEVTIVGLGKTVISASVVETETFKAATAEYALRVVPLNFHLETFDGAANITSGSSAYLTEPTPTPPSTATGIVWTTYLGSVRDGFGSWPAGNIASAIRGKKTADSGFGYLLSDSISGGIDSLAFDWNSNGDESGRKHNWAIAIYINNDSIGSITDKCAKKQNAGSEFRYSIGGLKKDGKFVDRKSVV